MLTLNKSSFDQGISQAEGQAEGFGSKLKSGLGTAAKVGTAAIAAMGTAAVATTKSLLDGAAEAAVYGDNIDKMSQKIGISAEAYQEWDAIFQHSGTSIDSLQAGMKTLRTAMDSVRDGATGGEVDLSKLTKAQTKYENALLDVDKAQINYNAAVAKSGENSDAAAKALIDLQKAQNKVTEAESNYIAAQEASAPKLSDAALALQELGISAVTSSGELRSEEDVFAETIAALQGMTNETERARYASLIFGRTGTELGALLNTSAEDTEAMRQKVHELGGVMSDEAVKAAAAYQDSLQDMQTAFSGIKRGITSEFLPAITTVMDGITAIATGDDSGLGMLTDGINAFIEGLNETVPKVLSIGAQIVESLITSISQNAPMIIESAADIVSSFAEGIVNNISTLADSAVLVVQTLIGKTSEMLPKLISAGLEIVKSLAKGISQNIKSITQTAVEVIVSIAETLTEPDTLTSILDAGLQIIVGLAQGLLEAIPTLIESLPLVIDNIVTFILDSIPLIIDAGVQLLTSLVSNMDTIVNSIVSAIPVIISNIINSIIDAIPQIIEAGVKLLVSLVQNLPEIITNTVSVLPKLITGIADGLLSDGNIIKIAMVGVTLFASIVKELPTIIFEILKAIPQIITSIVSEFNNLMYKIVEIGKNIVNGIWQGIESAGNWLGEQVSGFFGNIVNGVCDFLGIHSPSTVFAGIGENMALGVGEGFSDEFKGIKDDINGQMDFSGTASFDLNRDISTSYSGAESVYNASRNNAATEARERQPLIVVVQLESGLELARALIEDINDAKRIDGYAY